MQGLETLKLKIIGSMTFENLIFDRKWNTLLVYSFLTANTAYVPALLSGSTEYPCQKEGGGESKNDKKNNVSWYLNDPLTESTVTKAKPKVWKLKYLCR